MICNRFILEVRYLDKLILLINYQLMYFNNIAQMNLTTLHKYIKA